MAVSRWGMLKATFTLLAGGLIAQLLPLLLGPWLTRLYSPEEFGHYTFFVALTANIAVLACGRYDFALPLARHETEARDLMALCLRVWLCVTWVSALAAVAAVTMGASGFWLWLPVAVAIAGLAQLLTQWSVRSERFTAVSASRVTQYGGAALAQVASGLMQCGILGLIAGPLIAGGLALGWLREPSPLGGWSGLRTISRSALRAVALKHRAFPLLNSPHAFSGALQDTLAVALLVAFTGEATAGYWGLALRYLKAPASLVGGAVSQALYPRLVKATPDDALAIVRQIVGTLALIALPLMLLLLVFGPALFALAFGEQWRGAGTLARALAPYIALHFVASSLGVVTLAWGAQAWALRLALVGQLMFLGALALGLQLWGVIGGAWSVSASMALYFGWFFWRLPTRCPHPLPSKVEI